MPLNFEAALGIHEKTLTLRTQRAELLAHNIANADTPGYKAKDLDFAGIMDSMGVDPVRLSTSHSSHQGGLLNEFGQSDIKFRIPTSPSVDGNTVDAHREKASYVRNALQFQASFRFLNGRFTGMIGALKGE
ncbi:MAG: flagellar basal body rod protein FlgB [Gammaproteobacteria bacterium]|nr:MAG: flagellar basal body rod protein FlgB [Gammaproteobacteria bacterium]